MVKPPRRAREDGESEDLEREEGEDEDKDEGGYDDETPLIETEEIGR